MRCRSAARAGRGTSRSPATDAAQLTLPVVTGPFVSFSFAASETVNGAPPSRAEVRA